MSEDWLLTKVMFLVPLWLSLTVHEWAHAFSAYKLGDDTAARLGRMSLNPLVHIDPFGTLLLPLLGVPFGWAKPVPVNPVRFRRDIDMRKGMMITAAAGPLANVCLGAVSIVLLAAWLAYAPPDSRLHDALTRLLLMLSLINILLAVFNLLPIPPLDGSRIVDYMVPEKNRLIWERICGGAPFMLIGAIILLHTFHIFENMMKLVLGLVLLLKNLFSGAL